MTYEIIRPNEHKVYNTKVGYFSVKIEVQVDDDSSWCSVIATSKLGDIIFYLDEQQRMEQFDNPYYEEFVAPAEIKRIWELSNERLSKLHSFIVK